MINMVEVCRIAKEHIKCAEEQARLTIERINNDVLVLDQALRGYKHEPIALVTDEMENACRRFGIKAIELFRRAANDLGRPFLRADSTYNGWVYLNVPRSTKLDNLASMLLLTSQPHKLATHGDRWSANYHSANVSLFHDSSEKNWKFLFCREDGRAMFDQFIETLKTDPVARIILKLPR